MPEELLICTELDRTLIPNGPQPESPGARKRFTALVARSQVGLAYASGRSLHQARKTMRLYSLPKTQELGQAFFQCVGKKNEAASAVRFICTAPGAYAPSKAANGEAIPRHLHGAYPALGQDKPFQSEVSMPKERIDLLHHIEHLSAM